MSNKTSRLLLLHTLTLRHKKGRHKYITVPFAGCHFRPYFFQMPIILDRLERKLQQGMLGYGEHHSLSS
jgi:hypothetical protein